MTQNQAAMLKNSRRVLRRQCAVGMKRGGASFQEVADFFGVPVGTVKTWCARAAKRDLHAPELRPGVAATLPEMKPLMKPPAAQGEEAEMKPAMKPPEAAEGPRLFRGVTRDDLPGKSAWERSLNFRNLRKGTYPPRCWKIPGYLEGKELIEAIQKANAGKGRKRGKAEN